MQYCVVIIDGAAGLPLPERGGQTCLELASTPNLDVMASEGITGLVRTVPEGMEPSSACACMSVLGYDPRIYYRGRATIEAISMGIPLADDEVVFRCNLVSIRDGRMHDYSAGHITTDEARELIIALNEDLGDDEIALFPGVSYRHICRIKGQADTLLASCTPPHDIPEKPIADFLPSGPGSSLLRSLMERSTEILGNHPVNVMRKAHGELTADMIWLFWGSGQVPVMPSFKHVYGVGGAVTSGVDLLRGLARMAGMTVLDISGVTDGLDNDYMAQITGALKALAEHDMVVIHIEAPDEAAHAGLVDQKVEAIERVDEIIMGQILVQTETGFRVLVMPDHPTPIETRTHSPDPVPFLLWGLGFSANGASRFTENEATKTGLFIDPGYNIMGRLVERG
jgi:2,3-bisphosphoglycerate-independent phosphoglycerate mutase